jgi:ATP synthase F0 subunit b
MLQPITCSLPSAGGIALLPDLVRADLGLGRVPHPPLLMLKFVFPKLNETLEERAAAIQGRMEAAEAKLPGGRGSKADYEASLADARGEADRIIEEAKAAADALRQEARTRAEAEAAQIMERADASVAAERDRVLSELRGQVGALSVELASRIVERELDARPTKRWSTSTSSSCRARTEARRERRATRAYARAALAVAEAEGAVEVVERELDAVAHAIDDQRASCARP